MEQNYSLIDSYYAKLEAEIKSKEATKEVSNEE